MSTLKSAILQIFRNKTLNLITDSNYASQNLDLLVTFEILVIVIIVDQ